MQRGKGRLYLLATRITNKLVSDKMYGVLEALRELHQLNVNRCSDLNAALEGNAVDRRVGRNRAKLDNRATDILNHMRTFDSPIHALMKVRRLNPIQKFTVRTPTQPKSHANHAKPTLSQQTRGIPGGNTNTPQCTK